LKDAVREKFRFYEDFWQAVKSGGKTAYPILFTEPHLAKDKNYIKYNLVEQHRDVEKLLEDGLLYVKPYLSLTDDGIPVIRSDLGTTLLPSGLGLAITVQPNQHPWLRNHMKPEEFLSLPSPLKERDIMQGEVALSVDFYRKFMERRGKGMYPDIIYPYLPDTQGVLDLAHLIIGSDIFYIFMDNPGIIEKLLSKSLELFNLATDMFKGLLGEKKTSMVHGHGMPIGVWFPDTGARISEDSCSLISGDMVKRYCIPFIERAIKRYGRGFLHFCGRHEEFLRLACELPTISTLNLGNPEMYSLEEVFEICGRTGTVYFGHIAVEEGEDGESYLERLVDLCGRFGTRLILVSRYHPEGEGEKESLVRLWHRLTSKIGKDF